MATQQEIAALIRYLAADRPAWKPTKETYLVWAEGLGSFDAEVLRQAGADFLKYRTDYPTVAAIRDMAVEVQQHQRTALPAPKHDSTMLHRHGRAAKAKRRRPLPPWYDDSKSLNENLELCRAWREEHEPWRYDGAPTPNRTFGLSSLED